MASNNGSSKFDKAVDRARGNTSADPEPEGNGPVLVADHPLIKKGMTTEELQELRKDKSQEWAPQVYKLEEGDKISGILEGNGPDAEFTKMDKVTKEEVVTVVKTWIVSSPDGSERISILSSAQLDRKLPPFIGGAVTIIRGKDVPTQGGQRVTDYAVCGPKLSDGKRRSFVQPVSPKMIEGSATEQPALPAGETAPAATAQA